MSPKQGRWLWIGLGRVELDPNNTLASVHQPTDEDSILVTDRFIVLLDAGKLQFYIHEDLVDGDPKRYAT